MAYTPIGANNGTGTGATGAAQNALDRADFAVKFSTDVLRYFQDTNIMKAKITNRSISEGKSESFPIVGTATAVSLANTGAELAVQNLKTTTREILIGDLTVSHAYLTDLDKAMAHYDAQSAEAESIGRALAKKVDQDVILQLIIAGEIEDAASSLAAGLPVFDDDVFTEIVDSAALITGTAVYSACVAAVTEKSEKDAVGQFEFVFRPAQYYALLNNPANTGVTWVNDPFLQSGKVPMVLGHKVSQSPHFPAQTGVGGIMASGDCGGLFFAKESVGCLELMSISSRIDYVPTRLANLIVGKMAVGYGVLNHASCIALTMT